MRKKKLSKRTDDEKQSLLIERKWVEFMRYAIFELSNCLGVTEGEENLNKQSHFWQSAFIDGFYCGVDWWNLNESPSISDRVFENTVNGLLRHFYVIPRDKNFRKKGDKAFLQNLITEWEEK
ncbi:hypothetical protein ACFLT2_01360 [Acidobacteriota bacterium]